MREWRFLFKFVFVFGLAIFLFGLKTQVYAADKDPISINEICPFSDPACEDGEWIELLNQSDNDVALIGYTISDANIEKDFGTSEYKPSPLDIFTIPAQGLLLLKKVNVDFSFGINDSDEKIVLRKDGEIIDQFSYGTIEGVKQTYSNPTKGKSYSFFEALGWEQTVPAPGEINIVPSDNIDVNDSADLIDVSTVRTKENGDDITTSGTVTTLPGVLSSQYFYIQDETGGIQVYCFSKTFPALALGDTISVAGELSQTNNERRVKISSAEKIIILNHTDPIDPIEVAVSDIGEKNEGTYIKTAGIVTETSGDTFRISDGQSEIKVVINQSTGIDKPKMKKGDQVEVTGIVSQYKDEYRILPIDQDDVKIIASEDQLPRAGISEFIYFIISLFLMILWNIFLKAKKKLIALRLS